MCSSNCMREFQKFWQNSMHALFLAASGQPFPSNSVQPLPAIPSASVPHSLQSYQNYSEFISQIPAPKLMGLKSTHRRRRRRKRNRNKRLNQSYQQNSDFPNNNSNNNTNLQMRVKSIVSVKETHQMAEVNHKKNDTFQSALNISPYFIAGSSLDPTRKAKEALAKEQAEEQRLRDKRYALVPDRERTPEPEVRNNNQNNDRKDVKKDVNKKRKSRKESSESESESDSYKSYSSDDSHRKKKKTKPRDKKKDKKRNKKEKKLRRKRNYRSSSRSDSDSDSESSSSSSSSDVLSKTSDSSESSYYSSKNSRSKRDDHKREVSPLWTGKTQNKPNQKELTYGSEYNKTSQSIALNIRKVRKEAEISEPLDRNRRPQSSTLQNIRRDEEKKSSPIRRYSPLRSRTSRSPVRRDRSQSPPLKRRYSRSLSHSSGSDSRAKRLKSTVYASKKGPKEVPKSYAEKRNRSLSPGERSRSSDSDRRSRSRSYDSYRSESSQSSRSSRSRSYSKSPKSRSKSRSASSQSKSRSRSPSIPRRKGSPSFLDKRRITR